jgi:methylenetetrahydrofolate reductase (NADPH)
MTHVRDVLAAGPSISFEFFPPKTPEGHENLEKVVGELAGLGPSFVSVTYGALGSTRSTTRDVVIRINREYPFPAVAHLTCVGHTKDEIRALLDEYRAGGVVNILALGGDPPTDGTDPGGEFAYAAELVDLVRECGDFSIGVAAHPELHPRSTGPEDDRRHLADKLARADFGVTQFFFDAADYFRMIDELSALGCDTPVIPGVMLFTAAGGLTRMAAMNKATLPAALTEAVERAGDDQDEIRRIAVDTAAELCGELLAGGAPGLHLYTLNRAAGVTELWPSLPH